MALPKETRRTCLDIGAGDKWKFEDQLREELERIKKRVGIGFEVDVSWLPGTLRRRDGRQLLEEVRGDTIFIYTEDHEEALELLRHGFAEWLLNRHVRKYRLLINKLIEVFENLVYDEKERIVEAIAKLIRET